MCKIVAYTLETQWDFVKAPFASAALKTVKNPSKRENEKGIKFLLQQRERRKKENNASWYQFSLHLHYCEELFKSTFSVFLLVKGAGNPFDLRKTIPSSTLN